MGLYEVLKTAKIGAASDVLTTLRGQQAPFAKGGSTEHEYTGTVPYTFTSDGAALLDWYIKGNTGGVGKRTGNLFDGWVTVGVLTSTGTIDDSSIYANYRTTDYIPVEEGSYTFSLDNTIYEQYNNTSSRYAFYDEDKVFINYDISLMRPARFEWTFTAPSNAKYVRLTGRISDDNIMLNTGSTALSYEPYGYKIPVTCGGETKTIYLDEPLGASDSISMTDTGISIPTVDGSNTLSVGTTVQPSSVYIKYKE